MNRSTERLRLVPVGPALAHDLWLLHQDPVISYWYAGAWSREEAQRRAVAMGLGWRTDGVGKWMAYALVDGTLIGRGGLSRAEVGGRRRLEVGWAVRQEHQGHGYATEIGRAGLDLAFGDLGADEVVSFTELHNVPSRAVMARLGMTFVGQVVRPGLVEGAAGVHRDAAFALYSTRSPAPCR